MSFSNAKISEVEFARKLVKLEHIEKKAQQFSQLSQAASARADSLQKIIQAVQEQFKIQAEIEQLEQGQRRVPSAITTESPIPEQLESLNLFNPNEPAGQAQKKLELNKLAEEKRKSLEKHVSSLETELRKESADYAIKEKELRRSAEEKRKNLEQHTTVLEKDHCHKVYSTPNKQGSVQHVSTSPASTSKVLEVKKPIESEDDRKKIEEVAKRTFELNKQKFLADLEKRANEREKFIKVPFFLLLPTFEELNRSIKTFLNEVSLKQESVANSLNMLRSMLDKGNQTSHLETKILSQALDLFKDLENETVNSIAYCKKITSLIEEVKKRNRPVETVLKSRKEAEAIVTNCKDKALEALYIKTLIVLEFTFRDSPSTPASHFTPGTQHSPSSLTPSSGGGGY